MTNGNRIGGLEQVDEVVVRERHDGGAAHLEQARAATDARARRRRAALHLRHQPVRLDVESCCTRMHFIYKLLAIF